jgi:O-antigen/teichoic acid export membrane protein
MTSLATTTIFGYVLLPSYAKIQDEKDRLTRGYLRSTMLVMLISVPLAVGIAILAEPIIHVLLGDKWLPMIAVWQVFALYSLTRPIAANASPLFMAMGKPNYNLYSSVLGLVLMLPLALWWIGSMGIVGVALAVTVSHVATLLLNIYQVNKLLPGTAVRTFTDNFSFVIMGILMGIIVKFAEAPVLQLVGGEHNLLSLLILVFIGAVIYGGLVFIFQRSLVIDILELLVKSLKLEKRLPRFVPQRLKTSKGE